MHVFYVNGFLTISPCFLLDLRCAFFSKDLFEIWIFYLYFQLSVLTSIDAYFNLNYTEFVIFKKKKKWRRRGGKERKINEAR